MVFKFDLKFPNVLKMYELWRKCVLELTRLNAVNGPFEHFPAYNLGMIMVVHSNTDI